MFNFPWYIWLLGFSIISVYVWAIIKSALDHIPNDDEYYWW